MRFSTLFVLVVCLVAPHAGAQKIGYNLEHVSQAGGTCRTAAVQGQYGYTNGGSSLHVLDLTEPAMPRLVSKTLLSGDIYDIAVSGDFALVAEDSPYAVDGYRTAVVNIHDPAAPILLAEIPSASAVNAVAIAGQFGFYVTSGAHLCVLDLAATGGPVLITDYVTSRKINDVAVANDILVLAYDTGGAESFDISDVLHPLSRATFASTSRFYAVHIDGNRAAFGRDGGADIVDFTVEGEMPLLGSVVSALPVQDLLLTPAWLILTDGGMITSFCIWDIAHPLFGVRFATENIQRYWKLAIQGDSIYAGVESTGFLIVDIQNPTSMSLRGLYDSFFYAESVAVKDGAAYVSSPAKGRFTVVDVSDVAAPEISSPSVETGSAGDGVWQDRWLYTVSRYGMQVSTPNEIGGLDFTDYVNAPDSKSAATNGEHTYSMSTAGTLNIFDAVPGGCLAVAGSTTVTGGRGEFAITRTRAYAPLTGSNYGIIDVSTPSLPALVRTASANATVKTIATTANRAFLALGTGEIRELNLSSPDYPAAAGSFSQAQTADHLLAYGNNLIAYAASFGIRVLDISEAGLPREIAFYPRSALDVDMRDSYVYVAGGSRGLEILRFVESAPPLPAPTRVSVSDGVPTDRVAITWDKMAGADSYAIWRTLAGSKGVPENIGTTFGTEFVDYPDVANTHYAYQVSAAYAGSSSEMSALDSGELTEVADCQLAVTPLSLQLPGGAGETTLQIENLRAGEMPWHAEVASGNWLHLVETDGINAGTVTVQFDANWTFSIRAGAIRITSESGLASPATVQVIQASTPSLSVDPGYSASITRFGGPVRFEVFSRFADPITWKAVLTGASWARIEGSGTGTGTGSFTVNCDANPGVGERTAKIELTTSVATRYERYVVQRATQLSELRVTPGGIDALQGGGDATCTVSNAGYGYMPWLAEVVSGSWLRITSGERGIASGTIAITVDPNESYDPRSGTIRVTAAGALLSPHDIVVSQAAMAGDPVLQVLPASRRVGHLGGTAAFEVHNSGTGAMTWHVEVVSGNWVSLLTPADGNNDDTIGISYAENATLLERTAVLRITADRAAGSPVNVSLTQSATGRIVVQSPNGGERWFIGEKQRVRWASSGDVGGSVQIELLRKGRVVYTLAAESPNDGKQTFRLPKNLPLRAGYSVRITSLSTASAQDSSDSTFSIAK